MQSEIPAVSFGTFELIGLLLFIAMPVLLIVSYLMLGSRFKKNKPDMRMAERRMLSELAQLEKESDKADEVQQIHKQMEDKQSEDSQT
jgi:hypothetical protein